MKYLTPLPPEPILERGRVQNWQEIKTWAYFNDPLWNKLERHFSYIDETEKLKMLVAAQLRIRHEQINDFIKQKACEVPAITIKPDVK